MKTTNAESLILQHSKDATDAAAWRALLRLLMIKAYKRMTPAEIAELLPDLREQHRRMMGE